MKEFQIDFIWEASIKIDAESQDEALDKFYDMSYEEITSIEWVK